MRYWKSLVLNVLLLVNVVKSFAFCIKRQWIPVASGMVTVKTRGNTSCRSGEHIVGFWVWLGCGRSLKNDDCTPGATVELIVYNSRFCLQILPVIGLHFFFNQIINSGWTHIKILLDLNVKSHTPESWFCPKKSLEFFQPPWEVKARRSQWNSSWRSLWEGGLRFWVESDGFLGDPFAIGLFRWSSLTKVYWICSISISTTTWFEPEFDGVILMGLLSC